MAGRSPIQLGAEIYGCEGLEADLEVVELLLALLNQCQLHSQHLPVTLDIGHVGIFEALLAEADISDEASAQVFDALQRKSTPDLAPVLATLPTDLATKLIALTELHGASGVLNRAREILGSHPVACQAIDDVAAVVKAIECRHPEVAIYIDLAELRGFRYHTGLVFAAYLEGIGSAVAKGGRYDNVGSVFGRARPATGFACDLKALASAAIGHGEQSGWVSAPTIDDQNLQVQIAQLRHRGLTVVRALQGQHDPRCTQTLVLVDNNWQLQPL
jgi:ATP phosphoribosyltransferase regulatory subunit